jgi:ribosomal protein S27E
MTEVEFDCRDCGVHVVSYAAPSSATRCAGCSWLADIADPERQQAVRSQLIEHGVIGAPMGSPS